MAYRLVEKWLKDAEFPERYDFCKEIVPFPADMDEVERFIVYQAIGLVEIKDDGYVYYRDAGEIAAPYLELEDLVYDGEPDKPEKCPLTKEIFEMLWSEEVLRICTGGDTMNSSKTTLNKLLDCPELRAAIGLKSGKWSIGATVRAYRNAPEKVRAACDEAREFLKVGYTVGNLIPMPKGLNSSRGLGPSKDYWDLTLLAVYHYWFPDQRGVNPWTLDHVFLRKNEEIYNAWMKAFQSWDDFVEKNYLQDFVRDGRPEQLWEGHFDGDEINFSHFFDRATERIIARSNRIVKELRKKLDSSKTAK